MVHTVGQYIGYKDKNKVKIYDGDLVENDGGTIAEIKWHPEHCAFVARVLEKYTYHYLSCDGVFDTVRVIGNIHDKKEDV